MSNFKNALVKKMIQVKRSEGWVNGRIESFSLAEIIAEHNPIVRVSTWMGNMIMSNLHVSEALNERRRMVTIELNEETDQINLIP
jgi:hypothetical protein